MAIAWELYFQDHGSAPHAWCGTEGCKKRQPLVISTQAPLEGFSQASREHPGGDNQHNSTEAQRRQLGGFCAHCWQRVGLRTGRDEVASIDFMKIKRVFKNAGKINPEARLCGPVTENEFQKFVDNYLKNNKSPGPDGVTNECIKTMSREELDILRMWVNAKQSTWCRMVRMKPEVRGEANQAEGRCKRSLMGDENGAGEVAKERSWLESEFTEGWSR